MVKLLIRWHGLLGRIRMYLDMLDAKVNVWMYLIEMRLNRLEQQADS